ncbi:MULTISPECIES: hypothetical protein [Sphingomonas]|uniref:hypothetical protein n=1 Tax=Sphingomonas TaxID=13687 RepID=UPI002FE2F9E5
MLHHHDDLGQPNLDAMEVASLLDRAKAERLARLGTTSGKGSRFEDDLGRVAMIQLRSAMMHDFGTSMVPQDEGIAAIGHDRAFEQLERFCQTKRAADFRFDQGIEGFVDDGINVQEREPAGRHWLDAAHPRPDHVLTNAFHPVRWPVVEGRAAQVFEPVGGDTNEQRSWFVHPLAIPPLPGFGDHSAKQRPVSIDRRCGICGHVAHGQKSEGESQSEHLVDAVAVAGRGAMPGARGKASSLEMLQPPCKRRCLPVVNIEKNDKEPKHLPVGQSHVLIVLVRIAPYYSNNGDDVTGLIRLRFNDLPGDRKAT